jgi:predicted TPR repeat methyltransferase
LSAPAVPHSYDPPALALEHVRSGRYREAVAVCRERLAEDPGDVGALRLLSRVLLHSGHGALATLLLGQAVKSRPEEPVLLVDLGAALRSMESHDDAAGAYERALAADPASAEAYFGLLELEKLGELEACLRAAAELAPGDPAPRFALANLLLETGRDEAAREAFDRAVELDARCRDRHMNVGSLLAMRKQHARASRMYGWGLRLNPDDPQLSHMVDALEGESSGAAAPHAYVADFFDAFADTFEETLVERLEYQAPQLVVDALHRWMPASGASDLTVLDAGCGTGLCGPLLRPLAGRLVGIDLSAGMLEHARASGAYDDLRQAELVGAMTAEPSTYDVIVAADVLLYFGELDELFGAAAGALRPGGLMALTVERDDGPRHVLRPSGRYAHSEGYLRASAADAGLVPMDVRECTLRLELGKRVAGLVSVLQAPSE